jgi:hypothetical protein
MPIPDNIKKEHIFQAIIRCNKYGIPDNRKSKKFNVDYNGDTYPCKLLISYANFYANGEELNPDPNIFQTNMAKDYLIKHGFKIINK